MHKLAVTAALALSLSVAAPRRAEAGCGLGCPPWVEGLAMVFAGAVVGGYAYGIGYYAVNDLETRDHTLEYRAGELGLHGSLGLVMGATTIAMMQDNPRTAMLTGLLTIAHGTLAYNGAAGMWRERGGLAFSVGPDGLGDDLRWPLGFAYAANTLIWASLASNDHSRTYGIAEAAVNGPIAIGLGYLAIDRARAGRGGPALAYGGLAAISGALALHGFATAIDPYEPPALDLLGTEVMPAMVDDGVQQGLGVGTAGRW